LASDGDVIEVDAGEYSNDVAIWNQNDLTIRGVGGRARMISTGVTAEEKAIWVINGNNITVENIEFSGTHVRDRNGAGIRHQSGRLIIRNSLFTGNEIGLLSSNNDKSELEIESSEFCGNGGDERYKTSDPGHQIYVGTIRRFILQDSYVHHGFFGHLVKSRARENHIYYNRLTDERGGRASYELEFPNGGIAYVVGNIIEQSSDTDNPTLVAFGLEGYRWPRNALYLVHNTLVDELARGGRFVSIASGASTVWLINNLLTGNGRFDVRSATRAASNYTAKPSELARIQAYDYRLKSTSKLIGKATDPGRVDNVVVRPQREYVSPGHTSPLRRSAVSPGALQSVAP
jgi:hypothetical protein